MRKLNNEERRVVASGKSYIYAHYKADTNELFYIGVGCGYRLTTNASRNGLWRFIVKKHGFTYKILSSGYENREEALKEELRLQLKYKPSACLQYGEGTNKIVTEYTRSKQSIAHLAENLSAESLQNYSKCQLGNTNKRQAVINCRGQVFESGYAAALAVGLAKSTPISLNLKGKRLSAGKYSDGTKIKWSYYNN